jgi:hypothetical protein
VRRLFVLCLLSGFVVTASVIVMGASAAKPKTITAYCSSSGDVCYGVFKIDGAAVLQITTAARYFSRYTLCVDPPGGGAAGKVRCGSFPLFRRRGSVWGSSVKYARQFPTVGPGIYRVTWKSGGRALGPTLSFRLPLR